MRKLRVFFLKVIIVFIIMNLLDFILLGTIDYTTNFIIGLIISPLIPQNIFK